MAWQQRHRRAYQKAMEAAYGPSYFHPQYPSNQERYADWHATGEEDIEDGEDGDEENSSDSEIECDVSNMEISEELRQYFAQTEKHREELSKKDDSDTIMSLEQIKIKHQSTSNLHHLISSAMTWYT